MKSDFVRDVVNASLRSNSNNLRGKVNYTWFNDTLKLSVRFYLEHETTYKKCYEITSLFWLENCKSGCGEHCTEIWYTTCKTIKITNYKNMTGKVVVGNKRQYLEALLEGTIKDMVYFVDECTMGNNRKVMKDGWDNTKCNG